MSGLLATLILLGTAQGAFLVVAMLFSPVGNRKANRYLAGYVLVFTVALMDFYLEEVGVIDRHPWLNSLLWPREFFYGVFLYLYCRELTLPDSFLSVGQRWALSLPPFLHVFFSWTLLMLPLSLQQTILGDGEGLGTIHGIWHWILGDLEVMLSILHFTVLMLLSIRLLRDHRRRIPERFSYSEKISLDWLRYTIMGTLFVYVVWAPAELLILIMPSAVAYQWHNAILHLSMVILIYTLGWIGLRQPAIFTSKEVPSPTPSEDEDVPEIEETSPLDDADSHNRSKYSRSALSPELARALIDETHSLMDQDQLFLDSRLSLAMLAERLKVSTNYLSQAINQQTDMNFFDFVNSYRIRHAKTELDQSEKSAIDIAMDSGFNSKSAFYAAFRKHQQMTPGQYRQRQR